MEKKKNWPSLFKASVFKSPFLKTLLIKTSFIKSSIIKLFLLQFGSSWLWRRVIRNQDSLRRDCCSSYFLPAAVFWFTRVTLIWWSSLLTEAKRRCIKHCNFQILNSLVDNLLLAWYLDQTIFCISLSNKQNYQFFHLSSIVHPLYRWIFYTFCNIRKNTKHL